MARPKISTPLVAVMLETISTPMKMAVNIGYSDFGTGMWRGVVAVESDLVAFSGACEVLTAAASALPGPDLGRFSLFVTGGNVTCRLGLQASADEVFEVEFF